MLLAIVDFKAFVIHIGLKSTSAVVDIKASDLLIVYVWSNGQSMARKEVFTGETRASRVAST